MRQTLLDDMKNAHPVILIDGRHLIVGHHFSTLTEAFHTANALMLGRGWRHSSNGTLDRDEPHQRVAP